MQFTFTSDQTPSTRRAILCLCMYIIGIIAMPAPANSSEWNSDPFSHFIVIDAGHGGMDYGVTGQESLREKDITLLIAQQLAARLRPGYTPVLTRTGDYLMDIFERTAAANASKADIFISLHVGGSFRHKASGITLWYYPPAEPPASPHSLDMTQPTTEPLTWDTIQQNHTNSSRRLAGLIQTAFTNLTPFTQVSIKSAPVVLLEGADMAAVLIELGYLTHSTDKKTLQQADSISALCDALVSAFDNYLRER